MGTYKVIQDIEADDKLIGWMTPRQAIYATIVAISVAIGFLFVTRGAWWAAIPLLPHTILFAVLAGPFMHDQPAEVWLLAKIQFFLKPRKRVWDQSGISELVTITVPKKIERVLTDGLSQNEVRSRLEVLANVIDSRGWSTKHISTNPYGQPSFAAASSDRLIDVQQLPKEVPAIDVTDQEDVLDERMNPTAQNLDRMINQSTEAHRAAVLASMQPHHKPTAKEPADTPSWFVPPTGANKPASSVKKSPGVIKSRATVKKTTHAGLRTLKTTEENTAPTANPVVQQLASNDDLNVATIARQANKATGQGKMGDNEVVISLH